MKPQDFAFKSTHKIVLIITAFCAAFSMPLKAEQPAQTLILVGGGLNPCESLNSKNCESNQQINGKKHSFFSISDKKIKQIAEQWPTENNQTKHTTLATLKAMKLTLAEQLSKKDLLWRWRDESSTQLNSLSNREYNFVIDMLETPLVNEHKQRIRQQVNTSLSNESATNDIVQFIAGSLKVHNAKPSMLAITASSRDPYQSADFYEGLLSLPDVKTQWLALTPALVKAINNNSCDDLVALRHSEMQVYQRENIYPDRTQAEYQLCKQGGDALVKRIKNSTGAMFNGGDQSLARKVLFDENNQPYPWTEALQSRPVIVGTGAGTVLQSGGNNQAKQISMITNGTSLAALREGAQATDAPSVRTKSDSLTYNRFGGLGTFNYGVLDTHFSERNRTLRLATLIDESHQASNNSSQSKPSFGFGVDETTALVLIKSNEGNVMTVIGKSGVVLVKSKTDTANKAKTYSYSYWPAGSVIDVKNNDFVLSKRSVDNALPSIKIPPLPVQRFTNILTDTKLRSLTQAMCLSQDKTAVGQQDEFIVSLSASNNTRYHRINNSANGCAIDDLEISVTRF